MALQLPPKLKIPEIQRFALRATQLEKYRPIVTYWAEYYILQHVLNKNLHTTDEECQTYALQLMDKLEQYKSDNASNDAIVDDVAAKAYVENFALETFGRADDAQRANKVTKQTADTFMAAATFLDMLGIWGQLDSEMAAKSKFAKFHAARILRAFKAGEDPNATNPVVEVPQADRLDAELQDLEQQESGAAGSSYRSPTVEDAGQSGYSSRAQSTSQAQSSFPPPRIQQQTPSQVTPPTAPPPSNEHEVSPIEPHESNIIDDSGSRNDSIGGGYFPTLSGPSADVEMPDSTQHHSQPPANPQDFYSAPPQAPVQPSVVTPSSMQQPPLNNNTPLASPFVAPPPPNAPHIPQPPTLPVQPRIPPQSPIVSASIPPQTQSGPPPGGYRTDDESTMLAQKHARWAISALNFEDVNTAVKELRLGLQALGAT